MTKTQGYAYKLTHDVFRAFSVLISHDDALTLVKASRTLQRWSEECCGNGNSYGSWYIERDDETDVTYRVYRSNVAPYSATRERIPDRERSALAKVAKVCADTGLHYYHQTDPRGCALYLSASPIDCQTYYRAVAVECA